MQMQLSKVPPANCMAREKTAAHARGFDADLSSPTRRTGWCALKASRVRPAVAWIFCLLRGSTLFAARSKTCMANAAKHQPPGYYVDPAICAHCATYQSARLPFHTVLLVI